MYFHKTIFNSKLYDTIDIVHSSRSCVIFEAGIFAHIRASFILLSSNTYHRAKAYFSTLRLAINHHLLYLGNCFSLPELHTLRSIMPDGLATSRALRVAKHNTNG